MNVLVTPIAKNSPAMKRVFPMAIKAASKNNMTPRAINTNPKIINPIPIF